MTRQLPEGPMPRWRFILALSGFALATAGIVASFALMGLNLYGTIGVLALGAIGVSLIPYALSRHRAREREDGSR